MADGAMRVRKEQKYGKERTRIGKGKDEEREKE